MFALFFSLYVAMFTGTWTNFAYAEIFNVNYGITTKMVSVFNAIGTFLTSIFGDNVTYNTFGEDLYLNTVYIVAFMLALITSIGIVVVATKGIKKLFTVFFYGVR